MTTSSRLRRSRGDREIVPRGEERRRQITLVAECVFLAHGYADTTMQMVATEAGASKATLYRFFGSKEELFVDVINNGIQNLRDRLTTNLRRDGPLGAVLTNVGTILLETITSPPVIAFLRMIVSEVPRDPALGRVFHARGPGRTLKDLVDYLTRARMRGEFLGDDPALAAGIFLGAIAGLNSVNYLTLTDLPLMTPLEIKTHVSEVVGMFLRLYAPER